ncbi:hypothetical protein HYV10_02220 [Candidatus Dependentiae bacterium]|nr:hypothetical protein [Candidatus Dependentiae bacterium]
METLIYELKDNGSYWSAAKFIPYPKSQIHLLYMSFNDQNYWITIDIKDDNIVIWDSFDEKHADWENISKLYLFKKNYEKITQEWNKNIENPAKYLIFERDNLGWVTLKTKNELSLVDLSIIEEDRKAEQILP